MCCVVVIQLKYQNLFGKITFAPQLFNVTVELPTVPFAIVTTPEPFAVCELASA